MKKYESQTGYIKNIKTKECWKAKIIAISVLDDITDFVDISQEEYEVYVKEQEKKYASNIG